MLGNVIWIWGLSGSGKTTLGFRLAEELDYLFLDSDSVRKQLSTPADFSVAGRSHYQEALRHHVKGLQDRGNNMVVASITPLQAMRNANAGLLHKYFEVYLRCALDTLISRDPKGLYQKALKGEIPNFTGIGSPFEGPSEDNLGLNRLPDLTIDTGFHSEEEAYIILVNMIKKHLRRL
jgi:adenylylsulfate kinase-like enzyme